MKRKHFIQLLSSGSAWLALDYTGVGTSGINDLKNHIIDDVRFGFVQLEWPRLVGRNAWSDALGYLPVDAAGEIVVIKTDQGASGWGMALIEDNLRRGLADEITGKRVSELINPKTGIFDSKYEGFEFALYDLAGKILQKPVYQLLGREKPHIHSVYSGMIYFDDLDESNKWDGFSRLLKGCQFDYDYGYRQFKVKIGRGYKWMGKQEGIKRDIEITKLINHHFPDVDILVDGNDGFTPAEFNQYLDGIEGIDLFWIEEPFREEADGYRKLKERFSQTGRDVFIADGEFQPDHDQMLDLGKNGLVDVFLQDIAGYGFSNWIKFMPRLIKMDVLASPHNWGTGLKTYYTSHLAGALGNVATIEGVTCASNDVDLSGYAIEDGKLIPSSEPGFGMHLLKNIDR